MKNIKIFISLLLILFCSLAVRAEPLPIIKLTNCSVPSAILQKVKTGIEFALDKQAAFFIDDEDLGHVHLLLTQQNYEALIKNKEYTAIELMEKTDALLFHSQEYASTRNLLPVETQKKRNIYYDLRTDKIEILDVDKYDVDSKYYTIFSDRHLKMVEVFQISFDRLPRPVGKSCKVPQFYLSRPISLRIGVAQVLVVGSLEDKFKAKKAHVVDCYCSGKH
jgi:hypothetical protein